MMFVPRFGALRSLWLGPALLMWALPISTITMLGAQGTNSSPQSASPGVGAPQQRSTPATTPDERKTEPIPVAGMPSVISNGDLINVSVFGVADYVQEARVDANGQVTLPFIGTVKLAGMSIGDAETLVAKRLTDKGVFRDPQVVIAEKEYANQDVTVLGEVQKPGLYPIAGKRTLFDIISAGGGTTVRAGNTAFITHRENPQAPETVTLAYDASGLQESNVPIAAGDTVVISRAGIVYVVGDVRVPTGVVLENPKLTVLKALAMAQGPNPTASQGKTRIIRHTPDGREEEIPVPLKKILQAKVPDPQLQADDILFVPNSAAKSAFRRGGEAVAQMATGMVVYSPLY